MITRKEKNDGLKVEVKARLCLCGFKESEKPRSDSPTADRLSTKLFYTISANESWEIESLDITSAFLQGSELERNIFVIPPKEAGMNGMLWKMRKAAYGLNDASRKFWQRIMELLTGLGCKPVVGDKTLLYFHNNGKLEGLLCLHVGDILGGGTPHFKTKILDEVEKTFACSKRERNSFRYTGVDVEREKDGNIVASQEVYVESLEEIPIKDSSDNKRSLTKPEFKDFRGAIGKLSWISEQTRPDISYECLEMSCHSRDAKVGDLKRMNKTIKKMKSKKVKIRYTKVGDFDQIKVLAVTDGAYNKLEEKTISVAGRIIFLSNDDESVVTPIMWKAKSIPTVCKSAKAAETRAADKCVDDAVYIARTINEIYKGERGESQIPVDVVTDSQALIDGLNLTQRIEEKLLWPIIKYLKQCMDARMVRNVRWCDTNVCLADIFTKSSAPLIDTVLEIVESNKLINLNRAKKRNGGE